MQAIFCKNCIAELIVAVICYNMGSHCVGSHAIPYICIVITLCQNIVTYSITITSFCNKMQITFEAGSHSRQAHIRGRLTFEAGSHSRQAHSRQAHAE